MLGDDADVLHGYFYASRYITKTVLAKYGLDPTLYAKLQSSKMHKLKQRIRECLDNGFEQPSNGDELRALLGDEFAWVRSSMDGSCAQ